MTAPSPLTHRCGLHTLDYSTLDEGWLACRLAWGGCGATYHLGPGGWTRDPRPIGTRR